MQVLGHLNSKRPVDAIRMEFILQAEAFACLVTMDCVHTDGEGGREEKEKVLKSYALFPWFCTQQQSDGDAQTYQCRSANVLIRACCQLGAMTISWTMRQLEVWRPYILPAWTVYHQKMRQQKYIKACSLPAWCNDHALDPHVKPFCSGCLSPVLFGLGKGWF
eukprot:1145148-Pelagomonas_calceolata.AAC.5